MPSTLQTTANRPPSRRAVTALAALSLAVIPALSLAQEPKSLRVGVVKIVAHAALDAAEKGFEAGLASAGFKEGVQVRYDRQNAQGDPERLQSIVRKFNDDGLDLIHSIATPTTQAVVRGIQKTPVVFSGVSDPVEAGVVPRDSAPGRKTGTNVTGVSDMWPVQLQMESYVKVVPGARKWGTIFNPAEVNSLMHVKAMRETAGKLGLELIEVKVGSGAEVESAAQSLVGKVQAINIGADNTAVAQMAAIAKVCNQHKIALFAGDVDSVAKGAVAAYGMDYFLVGYSAGKKAGLVLKGVRPGDIAWGPVEKFTLVINREAARLQGVDISEEFLKKADKVLGAAR